MQSAECSALTMTGDGSHKQYTAAGDLFRSQQYFSLFNDAQTGCCVSLHMKFPHIRSAYLVSNVRESEFSARRKIARLSNQSASHASLRPKLERVQSTPGSCQNHGQNNVISDKA